jgi:2'-5' RNA ligase
VRAFLAVAIGDEARGAIARTLDIVKQRHDAPRWVRAENLHLTVEFLGGIEEGLVPALDTRIAPIAAATSAQVLRLEGVGAFPSSRPRVLWLGVSLGGPWFVTLARTVHDAIETGLGLRLDQREPRAHLTVARTERPDRRLLHDLEAAFEGRSFESPADRLTLFSSVIRPGGPIYTPVTEWLFRG